MSMSIFLSMSSIERIESQRTSKGGQESARPYQKCVKTHQPQERRFRAKPAIKHSRISAVAARATETIRCVGRTLLPETRQSALCHHDRCDIGDLRLPAVCSTETGHDFPATSSDSFSAVRDSSNQSESLANPASPNSAARRWRLLRRRRDVGAMTVNLPRPRRFPRRASIRQSVSPIRTVSDSRIRPAHPRRQRATEQAASSAPSIPKTG